MGGQVALQFSLDKRRFVKEVEDKAASRGASVVWNAGDTRCSISENQRITASWISPLSPACAMPRNRKQTQGAVIRRPIALAHLGMTRLQLVI